MAFLSNTKFQVLEAAIRRADETLENSSPKLVVLTLARTKLPPPLALYSETEESAVTSTMPKSETARSRLSSDVVGHIFDFVGDPKAYFSCRAVDTTFRNIVPFGGMMVTKTILIAVFPFLAFDYKTFLNMTLI